MSNKRWNRSGSRPISGITSTLPRAAQRALAVLVTLVVLLPVNVATRAASTPALAEPQVTLVAEPSRAARVADDADPVALSVEVSRERFRPQGADWAVLSRNDVFADALAASGLLGHGPLLLTPGDVLDRDVSDELDRVLPRGGRVYIVGGSKAVSDDIAFLLSFRGFDVVRLAGAGRMETAARIADEVVTLHGEPAQILLARAHGTTTNPSAAWADAIAAGAAAARDDLPLLLTTTDGLVPSARAFLDRHPASDVVLLGGEAALSAAVARAVPRATRVAGPDRTATAAAIAERWFPMADSALLVNGFTELGWAHGLIGAGLGADRRGPVVYVQRDSVPLTTQDFLGTCRPADLDVLAIGDAASIEDTTVHDARALAERACRSGDHGSYAFTTLQDDASPVAWPSCQQVRVEVNYAGAPADARRLVRGVVRHVERTSGLDIVLEPDTDERLQAWDSARASYIEPGTRTYEPVLVNWPVDWSGTRAWGMGGGASVSGEGGRRYVSGIISLDPAIPSDAALEAVLVHEFGHVLGLAHVDDGDQVMHPITNADLTEFARGDQRGLTELYRAGACG